MFITSRIAGFPLLGQNNKVKQNCHICKKIHHIRRIFGGLYLALINAPINVNDVLFFKAASPDSSYAKGGHQCAIIRRPLEICVFLSSPRHFLLPVANVRIPLAGFPVCSCKKSAESQHFRSDLQANK